MEIRTKCWAFSSKQMNRAPGESGNRGGNEEMEMAATAAVAATETQ